MTAAFFINPVVEQEVVNIIKSLPNKSTGADGLRSDTMRQVVDTFANPLTYICNYHF